SAGKPTREHEDQPEARYPRNQNGRLRKDAHVIFFFSSRRRHTRLQGDWSSDVCSSDLLGWAEESLSVESPGGPALAVQRLARKRSEERRVGKECRSRWWRND